MFDVAIEGKIQHLTDEEVHERIRTMDSRWDNGKGEWTDEDVSLLFQVYYNQYDRIKAGIEIFDEIKSDADAMLDAIERNHEIGKALQRGEDITA